MNKDHSKPPLPWALLLSYVLGSAILLIVGFKYSGGIRDRMLSSRMEELESVSELQVDQIVQWKYEKLSEAVVLEENQPLIRQIDKYLYQKGGASEETAIRLWMKSFITNLDYLNAAVTDSLGHVRLSYPENDSLVGPRMKPLLPQVIANRKVLLTDLHQIAKDKIVHLDLIIPLIQIKETGPKFTGLMILRIDPQKRLYPLLSKWSSKSKTSETLLIRKDGDSVTFLNDLKKGTYPALSLKLPLNNNKLIAARAANGFEGIAEGTDYKNEPVLAAVKKIPDSNWFMISKVDLSEVRNQVYGAYMISMLLVLLIILVLGALTGWTIWHLRVKFYRDLYTVRVESEMLANHYDNVMKYANDIITLTDSEFRIVEINDRACASYQYTREELIGSNIQMIRQPDLRNEFGKNMRMLEQTDMATFETIHKRKDGTTFPVELSARGFEIEGKKYFQSIGRDITERKNAEKQLIAAKEKAEESDRLKTAFLHNVSHEIRTPMNAIVGFSALLDDPALDDETRRTYTSIITESTNQLLSLIADIVEISNIEAGQVKLTYSEVNINHVIKDLYNQYSGNARKQNLDFSFETTIDDDRAVINTDKAKLSQILSNLIRNSLKFTRKGYVRFGYRVNGNTLEFYVEDTGIGIKKEMHKRIFDRFFQVTPDTSREFSGAGLGLAISKAYADLLGCEISVDSAPGRGSEFILIHPL